MVFTASLVCELTLTVTGETYSFMIASVDLAFLYRQNKTPPILESAVRDERHRHLFRGRVLALLEVFYPKTGLVRY